MVRASKKDKKPGKLMLKRKHKYITQHSTEMAQRKGRVSQVDQKK